MRGYAGFNFPAFHAATLRLRADGHTVFNPAEQDEALHGVGCHADNLTGDLNIATITTGFNLRVALGLDLTWICEHADAVYLLPGWETSKGATAERAVALALGLFVVEL
jgi:hypothetical protein